VRALLHDQRGRRRHGSRVVGRVWHCARARRFHRSRESARAGQSLRDLPAHGCQGGANMKGRILVVDDDRNLCELLESGLRRREFEVVSSLAADEAFSLMAGQEFDVLVTDLNMKGMNGVELCERVAGNQPDVPVIVITAFGSLDTAVAAIRAGAYDFITKPFEIEAVELTVQRAVQQRALRDEVKRFRSLVAQAQGFDELIGSSTAMRAVYDLLDRVADTDTTVLISGETGTGKEVVARALHRRSRRHRGPFVALNCAAMPEALLESELFGHTKGAFTDAKNARLGLFAQASGGTLFLDEIADMPLSLQPKLLRALQERTVRPIGDDTEIPFDARIVVATNRDIESAVDEGRFREDLFFRINVIRVPLPPLRARANDILLLAQHFINHYAGRIGKPGVVLSSAAAT